jgi:hypothetical protein
MHVVVTVCFSETASLLALGVGGVDSMVRVFTPLFTLYQRIYSLAVVWKLHWR